MNQNDQLDGSDIEHAIPVETIGDEYAWLRRHLSGCRIMSQRLSEGPGYRVDILELQLPNGSTRDLYFNVEKTFRPSNP